MPAYRLEKGIVDSALGYILIAFLLIALAAMPGLIAFWTLWHSMAVMFVLGFGGLFWQWSRER